MIETLPSTFWEERQGPFIIYIGGRPSEGGGESPLPPVEPPSLILPRQGWIKGVQAPPNYKPMVKRKNAIVLSHSLSCG